MPLYTVESPEGKRIKFEWTGAEPPTDSEMEEVFASTGGGNVPEPIPPPPSIPSDIQQFGQDIQAGVPITQAQAPPIIDEQRAITPQPRQELSPEQERLMAESRQEGYNVLKGAAYNTPESAYKFVKDISLIVREPVQTAKGIKGLSFGLVQLLIPGEQGDEDVARAMGGFLKDRYGSVEAVLDTFENDLVGFLSDLSVLFTAGGVLASKAGRLSTLGKNIQAFGRAVDPVGGLGMIVNQLVTSTTPVNSLIKTAVKFPAKKGLARIDELANAFLRKGLNVKRKSLKILDNDINKIRREVNSIVDAKTATGGFRIKTSKIVESIDELLDNADKLGFEGLDLKTIRRMKKDFIESHNAILTPRQVQDIKVGLNKRFVANAENSFEQVRTAVRKKKRQAARAQLEELHPELKALNADESVMLDLRRAIESRVIELEKKSFFPTQGLVVGGFAGGIAGGGFQSLTAGISFGVAALTISEIISSPRIQISVAKAIHKNSMRLARLGKLSVVTKPAFQIGRLGRAVGLEETPEITLESP